MAHTPGFTDIWSKWRLNYDYANFAESYILHSSHLYLHFAWFDQKLVKPCMMMMMGVVQSPISFISTISRPADLGDLKQASLDCSLIPIPSNLTLILCHHIIQYQYRAQKPGNKMSWRDMSLSVTRTSLSVSSVVVRLHGFKVQSLFCVKILELCV